MRARMRERYREREIEEASTIYDLKECRDGPPVVGAGIVGLKRDREEGLFC